ncbi:FAD binding domain-containing protein [Mycena sp. CBHHK59/15]|nr:FAD binding domain-containing protein [Mycena sp. CBHHK59/15]
MTISFVNETDVDVLIIGAGPAGLMCASGLARAGVNVRIVDQRPNRVAGGQADGIQPRTIEVFQMHMTAFYNPGSDNGIELTERVPDVTAPTARYPFKVTLNQGAIEDIFLDSMRSLGVQVDRPVIPTQIELDDDALHNPELYAIKVVLKHLSPLDGKPATERIRAKFVVRKRFGINMEGNQTDYVLGVTDFVPETDFPDIRNQCAIHSENGSCMIIPREGDKVRLYIHLDGKDAVNATSGRIDKLRMGPERLLDVARKTMHPYKIKPPKEFDWWTIYSNYQRVADSFSISERVFIAGDACHTQSPQAGAFTGICNSHTTNDSSVSNGITRLMIWPQYEFERRKYAQDLIDFDLKYSTLYSSKPRSQTNENGVSHEEFLEVFQTFGGFTSGIGIRYGESAIVHARHQACAKHLLIGQRMPPQMLICAADSRPVELQDLLPSDTLFKLLDFTGNILLPHSTGRADFCYTQLPAVLRSHWSKVLTDEKDLRGCQGGNAYAVFGIDHVPGLFVFVQTDTSGWWYPWTE